VIIVTGHGSIETPWIDAGGGGRFRGKAVPAAVLHLRIQQALEHARRDGGFQYDGLNGAIQYRTCRNVWPRRSPR